MPPTHPSLSYIWRYCLFSSLLRTPPSCHRLFNLQHHPIQHQLQLVPPWLQPPCPATNSSTASPNLRPNQPPPLPSTPLSITRRAPHLLHCIPLFLKARCLVPRLPAPIVAPSSTCPLASVMPNFYALGPTLTFPLGSQTSNVVITRRHSERAISEEMSFSNWTKSPSRKSVSLAWAIVSGS